MTTQKPSVAPAAVTLSRGWFNQKMAHGLIALLIVLLAVSPVYWHSKFSEDRNLLIFDVTSGAVLTAPVVDPARAVNLIEHESSLAAMCILNRSENGLVMDRFIPPLFLKPGAEAVRLEYAKQQPVFREKHMTSTVEIRSVDADHTGPGMVRSKVTGEVTLSGVAEGKPFETKQEITLLLELRRNPDPTENVRYYPLAVLSYSYTPQPEKTTAFR